MKQGFLPLSAFAVGPIHLDIGRSYRTWRIMRVRIPICIHDAEIVLCMLIQVFGRYPVATCRRLAGKCDIAFENLVGVAADLYVRTIAVERLDPVGHA